MANNSLGISQVDHLTHTASHSAEDSASRFNLLQSHWDTSLQKKQKPILKTRLSDAALLVNWCLSWYKDWKTPIWNTCIYMLAIRKHKSTLIHGSWASKGKLYTVTQEVFCAPPSNCGLSLPASSLNDCWAEISNSYRRLKHDAFPRQRQSNTKHTSYIHSLSGYSAGFCKQLHKQTPKWDSLTRACSWQLGRNVAFWPGGRQMHSIQALLFSSHQPRKCLE